MNDLSDSPNKARVVHVVLPITIMWREVDELTPETPFFYLGKKKKRCDFIYMDWPVIYSQILSKIWLVEAS